MLKSIPKRLLLLLFPMLLLVACGHLKNDTPPSAVSSETIFTNDNFVGDWNRTDTVQALAGTIAINNQTSNAFDFTFSGVYGANSGTISGTAVFVENNKAIFEHTSATDKTQTAKVEFSLVKDTLSVKVMEGDNSALEFGHNVFIDGVYTKSAPTYTNADVVDEVLPTEKAKQELRDLLGDKVYDNVLMVMKSGNRFDEDTLTYSGFIDGAGMGVDLLLRDDKIYCLTYGLTEGELNYTLFTNDKEYKDKLPPFLHIERTDYKLEFVYKP